MYLPARALTPEVDFRLSAAQTELRLTGECSPYPADLFFDRVIDGDQEPVVPGLRQIVAVWEAPTLVLVCALSRINTDSERRIFRLSQDFITDDSPLHIRWIVPKGEINTRRIGHDLGATFGKRIEIIDPEAAAARSAPLP